MLADPRTPREPFASLKYIPFSLSDPQAYLSLGADVRERLETNDAASLGVGGAHPADYLLSRLQLQADLHLGAQVQIATLAGELAYEAAAIWFRLSPRLEGPSYIEAALEKLSRTPELPLGLVVKPKLPHRGQRPTALAVGSYSSSATTIVRPEADFFIEQEGGSLTP